MTERQKSFVYEYWNKTEFGRKMIASDSVSDSDLLFLTPNNVKKMHGLPLTRVPGKKKRENKKQRKRRITSFSLFDLIEEVIEQTIGSMCTQNEFFNQFVDVKNMPLGDKQYFEFDQSKIATIPTSIKPIKLYLENT